MEPLHQPLREDVETWNLTREPLGAFGPLVATGDENSHVTLEIGQAGVTTRITRQNLQNRYLEIQYETLVSGDFQ